MHKTLYFPRWFWPNNLGDSCIFALVPKIIKMIYPECTIEVVTAGSFIPLIEQSIHVNSVRQPYQSEVLTAQAYQQRAFSTGNKLTEGNPYLIIYPENHPRLFETIRDRFEDFVAHDSINFVVLNYLLQLGIVDEIFPKKDFYYFDIKENIQDPHEKFRVAICPMTKTNGKSSPHPGCNGEGYRFNGPRGLESWKSLVKRIKELLPDIEVYEFSWDFLGIGDYHIGPRESLYDLYLETVGIDYTITNDGSYHHLFNLSRKPLTLFTGTKVTKPEFLQLGNAYVPDIHLECRKTCASFYSDIFGVEDKSLTCKLECEHVDPVELAGLCVKDIINVRDNKISRR